MSRSISSITAPAIKGPTDSMKMTAAVSSIQTTTGKRNQVRPGARMFIAVVRKLTPPKRNDANSKASASSQRFMPQPTPVYSILAESGGYPVQPAAAAPPGTKNEAMSTTEARKKTQKESMFNLGKAMSLAPIVKGMRKLPKAASNIGIATKKTMMVPCIVTSML